MKLGSLKSQQSLDGELVVVSRDHSRFVHAKTICPTLRQAMESWESVSPKLQALSDQLNRGEIKDARSVDWDLFHSPLPRTFQWADGSAFLHHVRLVRRARNAVIPDSIYQVPLMYQGGSDDFLAPREDIPLIDEKYGVDFEGEVAIVTDRVPMGISPDKALKHIKLILLVNDVTLRGLIPDELAMGFGFFQSKPSSSFAPLALTPDELGDNWNGGRVHLPLNVEFNGKMFGRANAGEMHFHFGQLIAHAARTRNLGAGTIIGSGTVSNGNPDVGSSCLVERRMLEQLNEGGIKTEYMKPGDTIKIYMKNKNGDDLFGVIDQKVKQV